MLHITLLDGVRLEDGDRSLHLELSLKEQALLIYLAWTGKAQARSYLGELFWEGRSPRQARSNLRTLLSRGRPLLDEYLTITREALALNPALDFFLDASEFLRQLKVADHLWRQQSPPSTAAGGRLARALQLYQGEFLADFALDDNESFNEWAEAERDNLRNRARHGWQRLVEFHSGRADYAAALQGCHALLELDPFDEQAHASLLRLYAYTGQLEAARSHYQEYCRRLQQELDLSPGEALRHTYREIDRGSCRPPEARALASSSPRPAQSPLPPPPQPATPLIGRRQELARLAERLGRPGTRVLSLVGPGGMGKTHLALVAAEQVRAAFLDGALFVAVTARSDQERPAGDDPLAVTVANALNLTLHGRRTTREQLLAHLATREMLLILDNVESVVAESREFVLALLRAAPDVSVLVTSREPLRLQSEEVMVLRELPVPAAGPLNLGAYDDEAYAAIQLFVERARRTFAGFELSEENLEDVACICRLVSGIPLAIELAAAWVGHFNSAEIAAAIERSPSFLKTRLHDRPARHQSMATVFNYSWDLLLSHERRALVQLSIFRGSFSREAADAVAGAPLPVLVSLVDKSMLCLAGDGRYEMHSLLRRFAAGQWEQEMGKDPAARREWQLRYGRYYLRFIGRLADHLHGPAPSQTIRAIKANLDDINRAWQLMLALDRYDLIVESANSLSRFYHFAGHYREAADLFADAAAHLERRLVSERPLVGAAPIALARLQSKHAFYHNRLGEFEQASRVAQLAAATARHHGDIYGQAESLLQWGEAIEMQGPLDIPRQKYAAALALIREAKDEVPDAGRLEGRSLALLGRLAWRDGEVEEADHCYRAGLAIERERGDRLAEGHLLAALGLNARLKGRLAEAAAFFTEAQELYHTIGNRHRHAGTLHNLGHLHFLQGEYALARALFEEALHGFVQSGDRWGEAEVRLGLGSVILKERRPAAARAQCEQALVLARSANDRRTVSASLRGLGFIYRFEGDYTAAHDCFQQALADSQGVGDRSESALLQNALGLNYASLGQLDLAWHYCQNALNSGIGLVDRTRFLADLAFVALLREDAEIALEYGQEGLALARRIGLPSLEGRLATRVATAQRLQADIPALSINLFRRAVALHERIDEQHLAHEARAALADMALMDGDREAAFCYAEPVLGALEEENGQPLAGSFQPFQVYLILHRVLQAKGDNRAAPLLQCAYEELQLRAARIEDTTRRRLFLEQVASHRALNEKVRV